jgi:general secretion pathway protein K
MGGEKGFALVLTLVITALLLALATEFVGDMYVETVSHRTFVAGQQAGLMAESGAQSALRLLRLGVNGQGYTSLQDRWGTPFKVEDERGTLEVSITEESGKLNLNTVALPNGTFNESAHGIWSRLLQRLKLPADLGDALADWIDANEEPHAGGAESAWYRSQLPARVARNAPLASVEELALVKGFDPATRTKLQPYLTVYGGMVGETISPININTAPLELLAVLDEGMSDDLARRIIERRTREPFAQAADLATVPGLETIANRLALRVGVKGSVFRVAARARVGDTVREVEAVARLDGGAETILYWREY